MGSAPKGSYSSWLLPDGRLVRCHVVSRRPRIYRVTLDGELIGFAVRWTSTLWRAQGPKTEGWYADEDGSPREWKHRTDAVDYLVEDPNA